MNLTDDRNDKEINDTQNKEACSPVHTPLTVNKTGLSGLMSKLNHEKE